jgi:hypothetical protein
MAVQEALIREPRDPPVQASPIAGTRPPSQPEQPLALRSREAWGYVFWGLLATFILVTEALAAFLKDFPIPTISWTVGQLEQSYHWFKLIVVGSLVLIATRITFYPWPFRRLDD